MSTQQTAIYKSLQQFLFRKNLVSEAVALLSQQNDQAWNDTFDEAYKSYATHRLGIAFPVLPTNLLQVDTRILDDEDWTYLEHEELDSTLVQNLVDDSEEDDSDSEGEDDSEEDDSDDGDTQPESEPVPQEGSQDATAEGGDGGGDGDGDGDGEDKTDSE